MSPPRKHRPRGTDSTACPKCKTSKGYGMVPQKCDACGWEDRSLRRGFAPGEGSKNDGTTKRRRAAKKRLEGSRIKVERSGDGWRASVDKFVAAGATRQEALEGLDAAVRAAVDDSHDKLVRAMADLLNNGGVPPRVR